MNNELILSIVIPTKDREKYLVNILRNILSWKRNDFEVIIHDNSDSDDLENLVEPYLTDDRVRYYHHKGWLSVVENFDLAIGYARGEVVTMIGDDDGILEESLDVSNWMLNKDIDAVLPSRGIYTWPDLDGKYNNDYFKSKLRFKNSFSSAISTRCPLDELTNVLSVGGTSILCLPRLYYGLVQRKILKRIKQKSNTFIPGPSPDMANAISVALESSSFVTIDYPLFISGSCSKSTSGLGVKKKHVGKIENVPHLPKDTKDHWEPKVPFFWSGPNIWSQSALRAIDLLSQSQLKKKMNFSYLYSYNLVFNFSERKMVFDLFKRHSSFSEVLLVPLYIMKIFCLRAKFLLPKLKEKLLRKPSDQIVLSEVDSIDDAISEFVAYKEKNNIRLKLQ
ncbi:glycosyltransferase [Vibrio vulnificus]|uniref:glycosyltransferase family 2 protein n=1 Tax=Vibrio vulnificus TaxID=672 RepID=UPI0007EE7E86|nr:glycosyltransferase family 2 protein [Vibrio vulnificus]ANN27784.1 Glycosyl transferase, family 2 [Vibrio vulnificus]MCU8408562.1 glycosyltransferase [Vibrio vulnificus]